MILVLLTRFCESEDSDSGYKLCQVLAKQGHDLFVTSVSTGKALVAETMDAKYLSMKENGSITLLSPDDEDPQPNWLTKYHDRYFNYLSRLDSVDVVIGTLPETAQTAVELARTLKSRLILLATANVRDFLEVEIMLEQASELWSVSSHIYEHNNDILRIKNPTLCRKHKEILLHRPHLVSNLIPAQAAGPFIAELPTFSESPESVKVRAWLQTVEKPNSVENDEPPGHQKCPHHPWFDRWLYCEQCRVALCRFCNLFNHRSHKTIDLEKKGDEVQNALRLLLSKCEQQKDEILERTYHLTNNRRDIENCTAETIKKMTDQYKLVQQVISDVFEKQITLLNQWKRDKLKAFDKEAKHLNHIAEQQSNISDIGDRLLKLKISPAFISQSETFIKLNPWEYLPTPPITSYSPMVYHQPFFHGTQNSQHRQRYMEEYILGYVSPETSVRAGLVSSVNISKFEASHLKIFFSALLLKDSIWVTGWDTNLFWRDNVFLNLSMQDMSILTKQKINDPEAESETIMCRSGDYILYAKRKGNEVHSFHPQSHTFKQVYSDQRYISVAAMCGSDHHVFILYRRWRLSSIIVLDDNFRHKEQINMHLSLFENLDHNLDMCVIKSNLSDPQTALEISDTIIISSSAPDAFVTAFNKTQGILWQLDCRSNSRLDLEFNPCSVSSSTDGVIFIADKGGKKVYKVSADGKDLMRVTLTDRSIFRLMPLPLRSVFGGISDPTVLRVDREGRRLVVVHHNGREINVYKLIGGR